MAGGHSGGPILGGTLETNEIYRHVASADRTFRMPKNAGPLSADEIDRIRRWVEQKTPWPSNDPGASIHRPPFYDRWLTQLNVLTQRYEFEYAFVLPFLGVFLVIQVLLLLVARGKKAFARHGAETNWRGRRIAQWCSRFTSKELGLIWALSLLGLGFVGLWGHEQRLARDLAVANAARSRVDNAWAKSVYGYPPTPIRPDHPKRISGSYYRGNCERNAELFNNGNYRTASFHLSLCDARHHPLDVGDPWPAEGTCVRLEIERAPGTTADLFSEQMMGSVFFSETFYSNEKWDVTDDLLKLETVEEGWRWTVYFPLPSTADARERLRGLIYLYTGQINDGLVHGDAQFGIRYDLVIKDGRLDGDSDLWMGSFGNPAVAPPVEAGKIPFNEWFDHRPMPIIEGENSRDPKLLGVEEYVKKGLIGPEALTPAPPAKAAADKPADAAPGTVPGAAGKPGEPAAHQDD